MTDYYKSLVTDEEVVEALLKESKNRERDNDSRRPRVRPNINFLQRTVTNLLSVNKRIDSKYEVKRPVSQGNKNGFHSISYPDMLKSPSQRSFKKRRRSSSSCSYSCTSSSSCSGSSDSDTDSSSSSSSVASVSSSNTIDRANIKKKRRNVSPSGSVITISSSDSEFKE